MIYLDNAATTRPCPEAVAAMTSSLTEGWGNPSAGYRAGREAKAELERCRSRLCAALGSGAERGTLAFTSGGTEADNLAVKSGAQLMRRKGMHIISSAAEHEAILNSLKALAGQGWEITLLEPDLFGRIPVSAVEAALRPDTALVSLMLVNNETGGVTDIAAVGRLLKAAGSQALLHTDAVQAFLKLPFSPKSLGADLISLSSHKIRGPKGAGALWIANGVRLPALQHGGGQEGALRSGTEAMPAISGFAAAAEATSIRFRADLPEYYSALRERLRNRLSVLPDAVLVGLPEAGEPEVCAAHINCISLPGCRAEVLQNALDAQDICVSRGSACAKGRRSHVLEAMHLPAAVIDAALRVSFSPDTMLEEVDAFCDALLAAKSRYFR